jgi:hypothetical protein
MCKIARFIRIWAVELMDQSINQSINQSVKQSINQSISQSVSQSVNQSNNVDLEVELLQVDVQDCPLYTNLSRINQSINTRE